VVGTRGENFGGEKRWEKKIYAGRRMGFSFIRKTASTGSSATGALVAAGSLQPILSTGGDAVMELNLSLSMGGETVGIFGSSLVRSALPLVTQRWWIYISINSTLIKITHDKRKCNILLSSKCVFHLSIMIMTCSSRLLNIKASQTCITNMQAPCGYGLR
jgi:hypothetical protein